GNVRRRAGAAARARHLAPARHGPHRRRRRREDGSARTRTARGVQQMNSDFILGGVIVVLLLIATFLALAETSITRMSKHKAQVYADEGRRGAKELLRIQDHPERYLNPVLLVLLGCHLGIGSLVGLIAERRFGAAGFALGIAFEIAAIFVIGEAAPKTWAV